MTNIKWKKYILFIFCTVILFANAGCNSESANGFKEDDIELPPPEIMIEATIEKLENANSLNYELSKNTATTLNDEMYYSAIITTSKEIFSPRCRYWIEQLIYPDYGEDINPGTRLEFYMKNDGNTLERGAKTNDDSWTAQLPVVGETAKNMLEFDYAMWDSYWFLLHENTASFNEPLNGYINDIPIICYYGYISAESIKQAFKTYYEPLPFWQDFDDPFKMLSGIPAMTLIDRPVPITISLQKDTFIPVQIELDITEVEKALMEEGMKIMIDQGQSVDSSYDPDIVETLFTFNIKGIDTLSEIPVPEGLFD